MDTSDDPVSAIVLGGSIFGGMALSGAFNKKGYDMPTMQAEQAAKTAEPAQGSGLSETEKKNRQRSASLLTKDWGQPNTAKGGLMGI